MSNKEDEKYKNKYKNKSIINKKIWVDEMMSEMTCIYLPTYLTYLPHLSTIN